MKRRIEHYSARGAHGEAVLKTEPRYEEGDLDAVRFSGEVHPDPDMVKYIFELQGRVEKGARATEGEGAEKGMDYHEYARLFWAEKAPAEARDNQEAFAVFEKLLIHDLQHIPMSELVYPEVQQSMVALIQQYGDAINSVGIWSTGDVDATGYQVSKIMRSNVIGGFRRGLKSAVTGMPERRQLLEDKTHYVVDNDKFERLTQFVTSRIGSVPAGETMKIVIIEDSKGNFAKAEKALNAAGFGGRFEIVPIWAVYSREGQKAAKEEGFQAEKAKLNGIDSFADLTQQDRFSDLLQDGYLFVDFDGVIGDNIRMREKQADVTYRAFLSGVQAGSEKKLQDTILVQESRTERATQAPEEWHQLDLFAEMFPLQQGYDSILLPDDIIVDLERRKKFQPDSNTDHWIIICTLKKVTDRIRLQADLFIPIDATPGNDIGTVSIEIARGGYLSTRLLPKEIGIQLYKKFLDLIQKIANEKGISIRDDMLSVPTKGMDWHKVFDPIIREYGYKGPFSSGDEDKVYVKTYTPEKV